MKSKAAISTPSPSQLAVLLLASVVGFPALAQQAQPVGTPRDTPPSAAEQLASASPSTNAPKEGFWGRVNPFARKKWVKKQTDPINDRLTELDGLTSRNAKDIQDVDARSQAGIRQAQSSADAANQTATAAGVQAQQAGLTAQGASGHVNQLNSTVNGLDQYRQVTEAEVKFHGGQPLLSADAKRQLDELANSVNGQHGYILDVEAHSPLAGSAGIQSSERLAEAVKRYLVTEHNISIYRMHAVALGNAQSEGDDAPVRLSSVHIRLMENRLAAQAAAPPQSAAVSTGAERP